MFETAKQLTKKQDVVFLAYLLAVALLVLLSPIIMRAVSSKSLEVFPYEGQPYFHSLVSETLFDESSGTKNLFEGRILTANTYNYFLFYSAQLFGFKLIEALVPMLLGVLSLLFFYLVLLSLSVKYSIRMTAVLALILSPTFIYFFTVASPDSLAIAITLLGFFLFLTKKWVWYFTAIMLFVIAGSFSLFNSLAIIFFLMAYAMSKQEGTLRSLLPAIFIVIFALKFHPPFYVSFINIPVGLNSFVSDLGGIIGLSSFYLMLFFIGLIFSWNEKKTYGPLYIALIFMGFMVFKYPSLLIYAAFLGAVFIGEAVSRIRKANWRFESVRKMTMLIIICGLLFSVVSYSIRLKDAQPSPELLKGMSFLQESSQPNDKVLSHYYYGYFIEALAKRPVLVDEAEFSNALFAQKLGDAEEIFMSRNPEKTMELLEKNEIKFIMITKEMKSGMVWNKANEGLLFLLTHSEIFSNIYSTPEIEIWKVTLQ